MSTSEYHLFASDGSLIESLEMRNGHGSLPVIWEALCELYPIRPPRDGSYPAEWNNLSWMFRADVNGNPKSGIPDFWDLDNYSDPRDKLLMEATFDRYLIPVEAFDGLETALRGRVFPFVKGNLQVNHWPEVMAWVRGHVKADPTRVLGLGIHGTSVCKDLWYEMKSPECAECGQEIEDDGEYQLVDVLAAPRVTAHNLVGAAS